MYVRVLIVDDEYITRQGLKHMLDWEQEGFQIAGEASNGEEALALIEEHRPHIVLSDMVMPVLDGIQFSAIMQERYPEIQLIILSSYDKFEYVKTSLMNGAADYVLKPALNQENLLKTLHRAVERIPGLTVSKDAEASLESKLEGYLCGYREKLEEGKFAEQFPYTMYRVAVLDIKELCGNNRKKVRDIRDMIEAKCQESTQIRNQIIYSEEKYLCVILNYRIKDDSFVLDSVRHSAENITRIYGQTFVVVSRSFSAMPKIRFYYREVKEMLERRFYYPNQNLKILEKELSHPKPVRFAFEEYTSKLQYRKFQDAVQMFREYMEYLCNMQEDEYKIKNLAKNLLYNYLIELGKYGIEIEELREKYFQKIDETRDAGEFQEEIETLVKEQKQILGEEVSTGDRRILEMKHYIKEHYSEPLELAELAEKFGFGYSYLSSYFKSYTKEGFSGYLNKIRIEQACALLGEHSKTVADISAEVGYTDQSYFCRVFKKITGKTPSVYRKDMQ